MNLGTRGRIEKERTCVMTGVKIDKMIDVRGLFTC